MDVPVAPRVAPRAFGSDPATLRRLFGADDLLPLWVAEPDLPLAPPLVEALRERAAVGWYGYESRPDSLLDLFWAWAAERHGWERGDLQATVSPSVGTSIGVLLEHVTTPGDRVLLQPPVFTDFKPLVRASGCEVARNPLVLGEDGRHRMDVDHLEEVAADPSTTAMVLCNPHNPVGRAWTADELAAVAAVCARHDVVVVADEIHADLALPGETVVPFATVVGDTGVRWAALHGPIKTFGVAGVCDSLVVSDDRPLLDAFGARSSQLHLTRNNVFALAAWEAAYRDGGPWLDELRLLLARHADLLERDLPDPIRLVRPEATYLAWLDLRGLDLGVPELAAWLSERAGLALSPGHWFGREGAGFARMTTAVPTERLEAALDRLARAVEVV